MISLKGHWIKSSTVYVILIVLIGIGVSSAYAIITLAGDVTIDGTLTTGGAITSPTITDLQTQITALTPGGTPPPTNLDVDFLDGIDSRGFAKSSQSCAVGQVVTGFDALGNELCSKVSIVPDAVIFLAGVVTVQANSMAIGSDGFPVVAHVTFSGGNNLNVIHCKNISCSDLEENTVVTGNVGSVRVSIGIATDGFPIIAYRDTLASDLKVVHCTNVSCSSSDTPVIVDSAGVDDERPVLTIGNDGFPVMTYMEAYTSGDIRVAHCVDATCTSPATLTVVVVGGIFPGSAKSIKIGSDGFPIVAYVDSSNVLKVVHCTNISCSTFGAFTILDNSNLVTGTNVSMAIGNDGFPIISYQDNTLGNLLVIHCTNVSCSSFDSPVLIDDGGLDSGDSNVSVGEFSSMVIGNDGLPLIAYGSEINQIFVRLVHCTNANCSTVDAPEYIAFDHDATVPISLAIGSDGFPVIVYKDTNVNLLVAKVGGLDFS